MRDFNEKAFGQSAPELIRYVNSTFAPEDAALAEIRQRSIVSDLPAIQMGAFDNLHLEILARAIGAKKIVEIGTLGGYSGISLLRGMAEGGHLHTFEFDPRHATVARESFRKNGFDSQATVHVGKALEWLPTIEQEGPFDLVFIDADKESYPAYLEWAEKNLRIGGVVLGDNAFAWGHVAKDPGEREPGQPLSRDQAAGDALRRFNQRLAQGGRFRATMLPTAEGLAMGVKIA